MSNKELLPAVIKNIRRNYLLILVGALLFCALLVWYSLNKPATYTSNAIIFPLTASNDNASSGSVLSALMGAGDSKSFTEQGSVNIIELAKSRTTGQAVASEKVPEMGNKTIAELALDEYNDNIGLLSSKLELDNKTALLNWATDFLRSNTSALINKNNSFQFSYTGFDPQLVRIISHSYVHHISRFYINLKREKARLDFEFASSKVDSLKEVMHTKDRKLIEMDERTLFTNTNKLQYRVPTENMLAEKEMIRAQYANAIANQQNAAYKLQKATPVIKVLDSPDPPYDKQGSSPLIFGIIGFILGFLITAGIFLSPILWKYTRHEVNKSIYGQ